MPSATHIPAATCQQCEKLRALYDAAWERITRFQSQDLRQAAGDAGRRHYLALRAVLLRASSRLGEHMSRCPSARHRQMHEPDYPGFYD